MTDVPQPTIHDCIGNVRVDLADGRTGYACWYPQMGGYGSTALIVFDEPGDPESCFTAYIWHDGEFPFEAVDGQPAELHHCSASQFIEFGETVRRLAAD
jgi:hypothetical protein